MGCVGSSETSAAATRAVLQKELDNDPYPGPPIIYSFINCNVTFIPNRTYGFVNSSYRSGWTTCDVGSYYPHLSEHYNRGYRLNDFQPLPLHRGHAGGLFNPLYTRPFQGIFHPSPNQNEKWHMVIVQSVIEFSSIATGVFSSQAASSGDMGHMHQAITENTSNGGRFVAMNISGVQTAMATNIQIGNMQSVGAYGVDLIFELPQHAPQEYYVYQFVPVPVQLETRMGFGSAGTRCHCDWGGNMNAYLSQGWRLVTVFMDKSTSQTSAQFMSMPQMTMQCMWVFEKPKSKMEDNTQVYEGKIVSFPYEMQMGFGTVSVGASWETTIQQLGNKGWELSNVLETPETSASFGGAVVNFLLLFQRKIVRPEAGYIADMPQVNLQVGTGQKY